MDLQELVPRSLAALWTGIKVVFLEDVDHRLPADLDPQLSELAADSGVASAGFLEDWDDEFPDVGSSWPARFPGVRHLAG